MPCNCDHLEPHAKEVELSKIACLLGELQGRAWNKSEWRGFHPLVYNIGIPDQVADDMIEQLCTRLQQVDVSTYSLEMQMWWKDHQEEDRKRLERELKAAQEKQDKEAAIAKLTPYERKLLGL